MVPQSNSPDATSGPATKARTGRQPRNPSKAPRQAKLAALKKEIQEGTFQVDASRVAERMIATAALSRRPRRDAR
jgi:anti-sigma28 factor (negative regulator of flagellin synthesis)